MLIGIYSMLSILTDVMMQSVSFVVAFLVPCVLRILVTFNFSFVVAPSSSSSLSSSIAGLDI